MSALYEPSIAPIWETFNPCLRAGPQTVFPGNWGRHSMECGGKPPALPRLAGRTMSKEEHSLQQNPTNTTCGVMEGKLPGKCAQMVFPYIPMQDMNPEVYPQGEALERGTLFPGLDLPFHVEMQKRAGKSGPAVELMALNFAIVELGLYLDTHKDDKEAFALYTNYVKLYQEGKEKYEKLYGPIEQMSTARLGSYSWLNDPWPWEYEGGTK